MFERAPSMTRGSRGRRRADLMRLVQDANRAILRLNAEAPTVHQHRRPIDLSARLAALERLFPVD